MMNLEQIYAEYHPKVEAYVRCKIRDFHEAEDLVSAVFVKIVGKLESHDPAKASFSTWVYTITRNTVTDYFRTRHSMVMLEEYMMGDEEGLSEDALDMLADALLRLQEKERDLIVLHYYKGYTLKTVAEMMAMSYSNAKLIHKKALTALRDFYAAQ